MEMRQGGRSVTALGSRGKLGQAFVCLFGEAVCSRERPQTRRSEGEQRMWNDRILCRVPNADEMKHREDHLIRTISSPPHHSPPNPRAECAADIEASRLFEGAGRDPPIRRGADRSRDGMWDNRFLGRVPNDNSNAMKTTSPPPNLPHAECGHRGQRVGGRRRRARGLSGEITTVDRGRCCMGR